MSYRDEITIIRSASPADANNAERALDTACAEVDRLRTENIDLDSTRAAFEAVNMRLEREVASLTKERDEAHALVKAKDEAIDFFFNAKLPGCGAPEWHDKPLMPADQSWNKRLDKLKEALALTPASLHGRVLVRREDAERLFKGGDVMQPTDIPNPNAVPAFPMGQTVPANSDADAAGTTPLEDVHDLDLMKAEETDELIGSLRNENAALRERVAALERDGELVRAIANEAIASVEGAGDSWTSAGYIAEAKRYWERLAAIDAALRSDAATQAHKGGTT